MYVGREGGIKSIVSATVDRWILNFFSRDRKCIFRAYEICNKGLLIFCAHFYYPVFSPEFKRYWKHFTCFHTQTHSLKITNNSQTFEIKPVSVFPLFFQPFLLKILSRWPQLMLCNNLFSKYSITSNIINTFTLLILRSIK